MIFNCLKPLEHQHVGYQHKYINVEIVFLPRVNLNRDNSPIEKQVGVLMMCLLYIKIFIYY